jgi:hypothetical protein
MTDTLDAEQLAALAALAEEAVNVAADTPEWPEGATWCLSLRSGPFYSTDALTVHVCAVEEFLGGGGWDVMEPAVSPRHLAAWIAAVEAARTGRTIGELVVEVGRIPAAELLDTLRVADG